MQKYNNNNNDNNVTDDTTKAKRTISVVDDEPDITFVLKTGLQSKNLRAF